MMSPGFHTDHELPPAPYMESELDSMSPSEGAEPLVPTLTDDCCLDDCNTTPKVVQRSGRRRNKALDDIKFQSLETAGEFFSKALAPYTVGLASFSPFNTNENSNSGHPAIGGSGFSNDDDYKQPLFSEAQIRSKSPKGPLPNYTDWNPILKPQFEKKDTPVRRPKSPPVLDFFKYEQEFNADDELVTERTALATDEPEWYAGTDESFQGPVNVTWDGRTWPDQRPKRARRLNGMDEHVGDEAYAPGRGIKACISAPNGNNSHPIPSDITLNSVISEANQVCKDIPEIALNTEPNTSFVTSPKAEPQMCDAIVASDTNNNYPNYDRYSSCEAPEEDMAPVELPRNRGRCDSEGDIEYAPMLYSSVNFTNKPPGMIVREAQKQIQQQPRTYDREYMAHYGTYSMYDDDDPPYAGMEKRPKAKPLVEIPEEPARPRIVKVGSILVRNNVENDFDYAENVNRDLGEGMPGMDFGAMGFNSQPRVYDRGMAFPQHTTQSLVPEPGNNLMQDVHEVIQHERSIPKVRATPSKTPSIKASNRSVKRKDSSPNPKATSKAASRGQTKKSGYGEPRGTPILERECRSPSRSEIRSYNKPNRARAQMPSINKESMYNSNTSPSQAPYTPRRPQAGDHHQVSKSSKKNQQQDEKKPGLLWRGLTFPFKAIGISK